MNNLTQSQDKQLAEIINELQKVRVLNNDLSVKSKDLNKATKKLLELGTEIFNLSIGRDV